MARSTTRQQKRKRDELASIEKTAQEKEEDVAPPPIKKVRETKKSKPANETRKDEKMDVDPVDKEDVWISATDTSKVGLYYGAATDERNWTGSPELAPEHTLEDACVWAAIQAIDRCKNDAKSVVIYTDCHGLCNDENRNPLRKQLEEKISKRAGSTLIVHTLPATSTQLQKAHELAAIVTETVVTETIELNKSTTNKQESSLDSQEGDGQGQTRLEKDTVSLQVSEVAREELDMQTAKSGVETPANQEEEIAVPPASWRPAGGLRNLLDILMAPFSRRARTQ